MEGLKHRFEETFKSHGVSSNNSTILKEEVSKNETMAAHEKTETENKQRDKKSHDQATKYEDTNEDTSKNKLGKFNDEDESEKRKGINDRLIEQKKRQQVQQVDDDAGAGLPAGG